MSAKKVLIVTKIETVLKSFLVDKGYEIVEDLSFQTSQLLNDGHLFEGIVTSTKIKFDIAVLDACPNLKWIGRMGSGMEQIDLEYAQQKNIACFSSPDGNANAVAEQALGMYLSLKHNIVKSHTELQKGIWQREANRGFEIEGQIAGIIGLGNNGYAFAQKLAKMGLKVLSYDIKPIDINDKGIVQVDSLEEIFETAQLISFHVPYNNDTHHYFNHEFLQKMQQPFTLLNLSRGKVVSMEALFEGMKSHKIQAAALDVWEQEPLEMMNELQRKMSKELLQMPNFIGTAHIGGYTFDALHKMSESLVHQLKNII